MTEKEVPLGDDDAVEVFSGTSEEGVKIRRIGAVGDAGRKSDFKRPLNVNGAGATRMRLFSSKLSATSLAAMERQINEWLDAEQIEVKAVSHEIGLMQEKIKEENLILCLWY